MIEKDIRKLSRGELVEVVYQVRKNEQQLQEENAELRRKQEERDIRIENIGSIAEAAISLFGIFESAQKAADVYLAEIEKKRVGTQNECDAMIAEARKQAELCQMDSEKKRVEMQLKCETMLAEAQKQAELCLAEAEKKRMEVQLKCETMVADAQKQADEILQAAEKEKSHMVSQTRTAYDTFKRLYTEIQSMESNLQTGE